MGSNPTPSARFFIYQPVSHSLATKVCHFCSSAVLFGVIAAAIAMYGPQGGVWTLSKPAQMTAAQQEHADCIERYRKGQRATKAGC